ncbi:ABC1 family-domain-containing protein [Ochromonadaceae sp. CCMP2298]|nr:ABC1 family-domain-containing protein [Ochromonadaceae sp. CCMP2298]
MTRASISRSVQIARALNRITLDFVNNRETFKSEGKFSVPKTVRRMFEEFGATYIKLGQFIASSPTIFPAEYVTEFQACLDSSPTVAYSTIRGIIEEDLGRPIAAVYASVDPIPLASASIAQVHRARLLDGTEVVIKVRKPGVDSTLKADLSFLLIASKVVEFINPALSALSVSSIMADIRDSMFDELDFRKEIENLDNFRAFLAKYEIEDAVAPRPYPAASNIRVLTMQYLKGVPLVDLEGLKKYTASPEATLVSALRTWALTVSMNDKFHADVHAGNLLVLEDGKVGFIDFGIVGKISDKFRSAIGDLFEALVADDFKGVAVALVQMGATDSNVNIDKFASELGAVVKKITSLQPQVRTYYMYTQRHSGCSK